VAVDTALELVFVDVVATEVVELGVTVPPLAQVA